MKQIFFTTISALIFGFSAFAQTEKSLCPGIEINTGETVRVGETLYFTVKVQALPDDSKLEYDWIVSAGTISQGQKTPSIGVDTTGLNGQNVIATIEIKGMPQGCSNTASLTGRIQPHIDPRLIDEFGRLRDSDVKMRLDAMFEELGKFPNSQSYIINYGTDKQIAAREKQIQKAIAFRKFDPSHITIMRGGANPNGKGIFTKIWLAPANDYKLEPQ